MNVFEKYGLPDPSKPAESQSVFAKYGLPEPVAEPSGLARRALGDTGISLAKGVIGLPEAAVGLANLPTGGLAGKAAQAIGFAPKEWKGALDEYYSPEQKAANAVVQQAEGFGGKLKAAIQNPSVIAGTVAESLPLMLGGGAIARALPAGMSAVARGALGEGIVGAGSASEQMRQSSEDGLQSPKQAIASLASGAGTAAFGALGGKVAQKFGIADPDTMLAGGTRQILTDASGNEIRKGLPRRIAEAGLAEGVLEELPQSMWEQAAQNYGTGKPLAEGVPEAAAMGMLAGGVMGAAGGAISRPSGPISKASETAAASGATFKAEFDRVMQEEQALAAEQAKATKQGPKNEQNQEASTQGSEGVSRGEDGATQASSQVAGPYAPVNEEAQQAGAAQPAGGGLSRSQIVQPGAAAPAVEPIAQPIQGVIQPDANQTQEAVTPTAGQQDGSVSVRDAGGPLQKGGVANNQPDEGGANGVQGHRGEGAAVPGATRERANSERMESDSAKTVAKTEKRMQVLIRRVQSGARIKDGKLLNKNGMVTANLTADEEAALQPYVKQKEPAKTVAQPYTPEQATKQFGTPAQPTTGGILPQQSTALDVPSTLQAPSKQPASSLQAPSPAAKMGNGETPDSIVKSPDSTEITPISAKSNEKEQKVSAAATSKEQLPPIGFRRLLAMKSKKLLQDGKRKLYEVKISAEFRKKHFVHGRMPIEDGLELRMKEDVTGSPYDDGWVLIDSREQLAERRASQQVAEQSAATTAKEGQTPEPKVAPTVKQSLSVAPTTSEGSRKTAVEVPQNSAIAEEPAQQEAPKTAKPTVAERRAAAEVQRQAKAADEARKIADSAPKVASLADRLHKAIASTTGERKAALEAKLKRLEAAKPVEQRKTGTSTVKSRQSVIQGRDDLVGAIMRATGGNGIAASMAQTIAGDTANRLTRLRGLFSNRGTQDLGDVAMLLREQEGYDVRDGDHLSELIRNAAAGDVAVSMERQARDSDAAKEQQHRDRIRDIAKRRGIKTAFVKFADIEKLVFAMMESRRQKAVDALDERSRKRFEAALEESYRVMPEDDVEDVLVSFSKHGLTGRDYWNQVTDRLRIMNSEAIYAKEQEELYGITEGQEPAWLKDGDGRGDSETGSGNQTEQGAAKGFSLEQQTLSDIDRQEAERVAAEKAKQDAADQEAKDKKAAEKQSLESKVKARAANPDNFQFGEDSKAAAKPMGGLFDQPAQNEQKPVQPAKAERGEVGASLTKEQRKSVLKTLTDVYKTKRAPREHKGVDRNGNDKYGYVHSPDLFEKSDITGAMIRYVVTLPDGRIAHPTELFADYTQSDIDKAMAKSRSEEVRDADNAKWLNEKIDNRAKPSLIDARHALSSILEKTGDKIDRGIEFYSEGEGKWFVVQNRAVANSYAAALSSRGYKEVSKYSNDAPQGEKPRWFPKEYADGTKPAKAENPAQPAKPDDIESAPSVTENELKSFVANGKIPHSITLYHGSAAKSLTGFNTPIVFLAANKEDAGMFATHPVLNHGATGDQRVYSVTIPAGKIEDISEIVDDSLDGDRHVNEVINEAIKDRLPYGYKYVAFNHPGFGDEYFLAVVSGDPKSLKIVGSESAKPEPTEKPAISGYANQPESLKWAENDVGGRVVYSHGDIALLEGFSPFGNPVYSGIKVDSRTRVDIDSYTGQMFNETEKAELLKARASHITEQGKIHEARPDGPFIGGKQLAKTDGVSAEIAGVAQKWLTMLGIKSRVFIATKADVSSVEAIDKYGLRGPFAAIRSSGTKKDEDGGKRTLPNGDHYIILPPATRKSAELETLAHEIGHILETDEWVKADPAIKAAVMADYQKWLSSAGNTSAKDWVSQLRAHTTGKQTGISTNSMADKLPAYWTSFGEYFADQVSRWATTTDKPLTAVDSFFKRIAVAMRRLYSSLAGKPFLPTVAMKSYLDGRDTVAPLSAPEPTAKPEAVTPKTARQIIMDVARARPFDDFNEVREAANKQIVEQTGKPAKDHADLSSTMMRDDFAQAIHDGQYQGMVDYSKTIPVSISDGGITRSEAAAAFNGTSYSPEQRGESTRRGLFRELMGLWRGLEKAYNAAPEDRQDAFVSAFNDMAAKYAGMTRAYLSAHSRVVSSMIAGPSNFPVSSQRKKSDTADRRASEANEYLRKAPARLMKVLRGRIDNSLTAQIAEAESKLADRESHQAMMKSVNTAHGKFMKDPASLDKTEFSEAVKKTIREYKPRYSWEPHPFAPYELSNNNAEIRRMRSRVAELKQRAENADTIDEQTDDQEIAQAEDSPVRMVRNAEEGRLQLLFDGKPSEEIRNDLKASGFRWSPRNSAWQRQLTANAEAAAKTIIDKHFQPKDDGTRFNVAANLKISPADSAVYEMARDGKSAAEILEFLGKASRNGFNRYLANALRNMGVSSTVKLDSMGGWAFNRSKQGPKYAAAYSPKTDTIALFTPREAERHILHEFVHGVTLKAIMAGGRPALEMKRLFEHVKASGALDGMYGMTNLDEFVAEAFSNPEFQRALMKVAAPRAYTVKTAWDAFVRFVAKLVGLKSPALQSALDKAMVLGAELMRENAKLSGKGGDTRFSRARKIGDTTIIENPTRQQARVMLAKSDYKELRGLQIPETGKLFIWDASKLLHEQAATELGFSSDEFQQLMRKTDGHGKGLLNIKDLGEGAYPYPIFSGERKDDLRFSQESDTIEGKGRAANPDELERSVTDSKVVQSPARNESYTINVDGTNRPRTNSNGKPIAGTDEALRKFWRWFGDSKVTDERGRPLVVYHGTGTSLSEFDAGKTTGGKASGGYTSAWGSFFSPSPKEASIYAGVAGNAQNVMPVYLAIAHPMEMNRSEWGARSNNIRKGVEPRSAAKDEAKIKGHDGIIVSDKGFNDELVAFSPNQVKSATGNSGEFSPENPDIRFNAESSGQWVSSSADNNTLDDIIYKMANKQIDLRRTVQDVTKKIGAIADEYNPELAETLYHGKAANETKNFLDFELRPLIRRMLALGVDTETLETYLWARHAEERNEQIAKINPRLPDGGSGLTNAQARQLLAGQDVTIDGKTIKGVPQDKLIEIGELASMSDAILKKSRKLLVDSGLESQAEVDSWSAMYQHYAPLHREEFADDRMTGKGLGMSIKGPSGKRAIGSEKPVSNILASIVSQREMYITRAEKNKVGNATYGLATIAPNEDFWKAIDPMANASRDAQQLWAKIRKQSEILASKPDGDEAMEAIIDAMKAQHKALMKKAIPGMKKVKESLEALGLPAEMADRILAEPKELTINKRTGMVVERVNPLLRHLDNVLATRINGRDVFVVFNARNKRASRMAMAMKNLDADNLGFLLGNMAKATRYFAAINTQFNPIFGVTNLTRDIQTAMLNLSSTPLAGHKAEIAKRTFSALRGIYSDLRDNRAGKAPSSKWAETFEQFKANGGATGYRDMYDSLNDRAKDLQDELKKMSMSKGRRLATLGQSNPVFAWLSDYNEMMENAARVAAFSVAIEQDPTTGKPRMSPAQAAALAKELTVNFNRKGQVAAQAGAMYAFFNAAVQGTSRIAQTLVTLENGKPKLTHVGKKIIAGGVMVGVVQAILGALAGWDDEEPPQFVRERSLIIPIGDHYVSIPMPLGYNVLPNIGRITTEFALSGFKDPAKRISSMINVLFDTFNPIGNAGMSLQTITPTVIDPLAALSENKDWTGKPIKRLTFNEAGAGYKNAKDTATAWSKMIAEGLNYLTGGTEHKAGLMSPTPDQIDYLIGQVTGGVGRELSKVVQTGSSIISGEDLPLYKIPLAGKFVGSTTGQAAESSRFYANLDELKAHKAEIDGRRKAHQDVAGYLQDNPDARLVPMATRIEHSVQELRRAKRVLLAKSAPPEQVKAIDARITAYMKVLNVRVDALQRESR